MSILNVNQIQPVGSGQTVTISAANITASSSTISASSFVGPLTGNVTGSVSGGSFSGISTAGITTAYIGSINDGSISGARNRIINGDMRLDQRNNGSSVTRATTDANQLYILDRWDNTKNSNSKAYTIQRSGTAPVGFTSSLLLTITSTNGTNSSTDYNIIRQYIEGYNVADLMWGTANAKPVTFSFWVRSSVTGTYAVCLVIQGQGNYPATYTVNSANTWEYKSMTVPGPTSGTWPTDNTAGLGIYFDLGVGSLYSTTTNTWTYGQNVFGGSGVTKLTETNGATWYITGVQLESGTVATPFERRSYGQELALCQRYYYKLGPVGSSKTLANASADSATSGWAIGSFPVTMRTSPTALEQSGTASDYVVRTGGVSRTCSAVPTFDNATTDGWMVALTVASGQTAGQAGFLRAASVTTAYLAWSAEL